MASTNPASNPTASLSVATTTISDNTAAGSGGGAFLRDVRADITGGYMSGNSAGISTNSSGGALHFRASAGYAYAATTLAMSKVTLNANLAGAGGAIFLLKESRNRVGIACLGCTLTDNRVPGVGAGSAVATLDRGGEQLTVDLTDSKWAGEALAATGGRSGYVGDLSQHDCMRLGSTCMRLGPLHQLPTPAPPSCTGRVPQTLPPPARSPLIHRRQPRRRCVRSRRAAAHDGRQRACRVGNAAVLLLRHRSTIL